MAAEDIGALLAGFPELAQLLSMQAHTAQQQQPLREALTQQSLNFLPRSSRSAAPGVTDVRGMAPLPGGGGTAADRGNALLTFLKYLAAGGAGFLAGRGTAGGSGGPSSGGGSIDLGKLFGNLFHHGPGGRVTGNYNPADYYGIDPDTGMPYESQGPTQPNDPSNAGGLEDFNSWLDEQTGGGNSGQSGQTVSDPSEWGY